VVVWVHGQVFGVQHNLVLLKQLVNVLHNHRVNVQQQNLKKKK
jgi:hypothetical protein